jgi:hypothetical protein
MSVITLSTAAQAFRRHIASSHVAMIKRFAKVVLGAAVLGLAVAAAIATKLVIFYPDAFR